MKVYFEKVIPHVGESILMKEINVPRFPSPLHFHPEIELTLILESSGKRFIGDSVEDFKPGDLVLVGGNLPHFWCNGNDFSAGSAAIVVQFDRAFAGDEFFTKASAYHIINLLNSSSRGICINPLTKEIIQSKIIKMLHMDNFSKTMGLIEILDIIAESQDYYYLSSQGFKWEMNEVDCTKMDKVYNYVYSNINRSFEIAEIADLIHMSTSAFCHYFKKTTQKTFTQFVNEIRIGNAKRLLIETDKAISEIAYECGYNSLSNFSKQFSNLVNISPRDFRHNYILAHQKQSEIINISNSFTSLRGRSNSVPLKSGRES